MKHSLGRRIAATFIALMTIILIAICLFQWFFLDAIYLHEKKKEIKSSWEMIESIADETPDDNFINYCRVHNFEFCVTDGNLNALYTNTQSYEAMLRRLFGIVLDKEEENIEILQSTETYQLIRARDSQQSIDYLELWGVLRNGNYYMVQSPIQGVSEAASIGARTTVVLGLFGIGIGVGVIIFLTRRVLRPVRELTEISEHMTNLDFDVRYESGGEDEIGELGRNFNTMQERLKTAITDLRAVNEQLERDVAEKTEAEKRGREFIANVSHELKTPLAIIQGYAEGLRDNVNDDDESREYYCEVIVDESGKMNHLVKQLLSLAQLESGREELQKETFDLTGMIYGVLASTELIIAQSGAEISVEADEKTPVLGDEFRIEEVVINYLNNALQHLDGEKKIRITCHKQGERAVVTFFNTGDSIPEEDLPRLFEKFFKVDKARTREYGGSGIGLSIVKAVIDAHGGSCGARNVEGGVEFYFSV